MREDPVRGLFPCVKGEEEQMVRMVATITPKGGRRSWLRYARARKSTLQFFFLLCCGLAWGSFYALGEGDGSQLLRAIMLKELVLQQQRSFRELVISGAVGMLGMLLYLYLCLYCSKGNWLVLLIPFIFGLATGSQMAVLLTEYGLSVWAYLISCVFIPRLLMVLLLLSACNKCIRSCVQQSTASRTSFRKEERGEEISVRLYFVLFLLALLFQSFLLYIFRGLLWLQ